LRRLEIQEIPRKYPGGIQEDPGGIQEAREILETECVFSYAPAHKSDASDHFRVEGSDVTITVYCACAQEFATGGAKIAGHHIPNTEDTPPEHLQLGNPGSWIRTLDPEFKQFAEPSSFSIQIEQLCIH